MLWRSQRSRISRWKDRQAHLNLRYHFICQPLVRVTAAWWHLRTSPPHALTFYIPILALLASVAVMAKVNKKTFALKPKWGEREVFAGIRKSTSRIGQPRKYRSVFNLQSEKNSKFKVLACRQDKADLHSNLCLVTGQNFGNVKHAKGPASIVRSYKHIYVKRNQFVKSCLTGGLPESYGQANT